MLTWLFILLLLGGVGFPIPEEIPLFIGGLAVAQGVERWEIVFLVCYAGVLIGDQTMYLLGYYFGRRILDFSTRSPYFPAITIERVNEVREGLRKRRLVYLFVGRHLFVLRSVTFVVAGSLRVPYVEFFLADSVAALFSVALFMGLGYLLGDHIDADVVSQMTHRANLILLTLLLVGVSIWYWMSKRRALAAARNACNSAGEPTESDRPRNVCSDNHGNGDDPDDSPKQLLM